jgi:hypothetical protein
LGKTFLYTTQNGEQVKAQVIKKINDLDAAEHINIKFLIDVADGAYEDIIGYVTLCDLIEEQESQPADSPDTMYTFDSIIGHEGPLKATDPQYKGSRFNVEIKWSNGSVTMEPLATIIQDDPIECARYAVEHDMLDVAGWKKLKPVARQHRLHMVNKCKLQFTGTTYKFGVQVPSNLKMAQKLDTINGENKWKDARDKELAQLYEYEVFKDIGKGTCAPDGYKKIRVHCIYDIKHDLRRKARYVADGHLTDPCKDVAYSSVVSLHTMRIALVVSEMNRLVMVGDIGNTYL